MKTAILMGITFISIVSCKQKDSNCCDIPPKQGRSGVSTIIGNNVLGSVTQTMSNFKAIEVVGSVNVRFIDNPTDEVKIEGETNIIKLLDLKVNDGVLVIDFKPETNIRSNQAVVVTLSNKLLERIALDGSGELVGPLNSPKMRLDLNGSGDIDFSGSVNKLTVNLNGSGNINLSKYVAQMAIVSLNGSGEIQVNASKDLQISLDGSGKIEYSGSAKVTKSINGSGEIMKK